MDIAKKIKTMLDVAAQTHHEGESEVFLGKAYDMMEAHGIELMDLGKLDNDDPVDYEDKVYRSGQCDPWRKRLGTRLARFYGCQLVLEFDDKGYNAYWTIVGRESARTTFKMMWPFINEQVMKIAREELKAGYYSTIRAARTDIANGLILRIGELMTGRKPRADEAVSNALVPVDQIQKILEDMGTYTHDRRRQISVSENGLRAADGISLDPQAGTDKPCAQQLR